ncbi:DUF6246 family protein [Klebsiella aerogenes]|uniref:DUF6246 family protein n=1 Tax=Klebsiella aerogenes TaxID=548 RepID=UPI00254A2B81|nr:DUF6246 family protein [Klebsiella aerogenes]MDK7100855.1 DUF6246 family protein [Klebsiella aerogenes]MDK7645367.1 DUF6246 family protein [Klebsiella aerogenes]MDK7850568.1 DUF6246 family protein [Klebsiella aerogenes]MDK8313863.1 DUF6246 family protein [Klebsiella aerogenes]HDH0723290.1 hypothetical protein [Klebsiella aerogenes]
MTPVKEFGECLITSGDKEYFFRPSLLAMTRIGEPAEIVQTFYDLCNDEATPLIQQAAQVYIRDEYSRLPDCVLRYIQSGILSRKAVMAAHAVLTACCDDDIGELVGWMKPGKSRKRGFMWRPGTMPAPEMIIVAQNLMMHGIIGKAKVRKLQRHETSDTTNEFRASEYIVAARNHFGISKEEAWQLTMTEFQLMLIAKYPEQKGYTREEYDHAADDYFARRKRRQAKSH